MPIRQLNINVGGLSNRQLKKARFEAHKRAKENLKQIAVTKALGFEMKVYKSVKAGRSEAMIADINPALLLASHARAAKDKRKDKLGVGIFGERHEFLVTATSPDDFSKRKVYSKERILPAFCEDDALAQEQIVREVARLERKKR